MKKGLFNQVTGRIITGLENKEIPFYCYVLTFLAVVFMRLFIEAFATSLNFLNEIDGNMYMKIVVFMTAYLAIALLEAIMISKVVKINISKVLRVLFPVMLIFLLIPILDIILTWGGGVRTMWMTPENSSDLLKAFFSYYNDERYVSLGQQIGSGLLILTIFVYCMAKGLSWISALLTMIAGYTLIFLWGMFPYFVKLIMEMFNYEYRLTGAIMLRFFLILDIILMLYSAYLADPKVFVSMLRDARGSRIVFYILFMLLGTVLSISMQPLTPGDYLHAHSDVAINTILFAICIAMAGMFSLMINNFYDVDIDKVSNPDRPLVSGVVDTNLYLTVAYTFLALTLFYVSAISGKIFMIIAAVMSSYYLYSAPPIRFKRVPILSKLVIGMNTFALTVAGFVIAKGNVYGFPASMVWICLIGVTLASNYIDLKDIKGDKAAGILTLPVLIGEKWAKRLIGVALFGLSVAFVSVLRDLRFLPLLAVAGALLFFLVNRRGRNDKLIMWFINICLFAIIVFIFSRASVVHTIY